MYTGLLIEFKPPQYKFYFEITSKLLINFKYSVSGSSNSDFHPDCTKFCSVFQVLRASLMSNA